jgi:hypothetical protein
VDPRVGEGEPRALDLENVCIRAPVPENVDRSVPAYPADDYVFERHVSIIAYLPVRGRRARNGNR